MSDTKREHDRFKPVLAKAREFDIATNPGPFALFEAGSAGFQLWCSPEDHPAGYDVLMYAGAFAKPCAYVGDVCWGWDDAEKITHLVLDTCAYELADGKPEKFSRQLHPPKGKFSIHNRPADILWAKGKIRWLFKQAGVPCPPIKLKESVRSQLMRDEP